MNDNGSATIAAPPPPSVDALRVDLRDASYLVIPGGHAAYWDKVSNGEWDPDIFGVFRRFLDHDHSYIDMGTYIGTTILYGCQFAKAAYGVEPDPVAYAELVANVAVNRPTTDNVEVAAACICPRTGEVAFGSLHEGGDSCSSLLFARGKTRWTVEGLSFEDFVRRYRIDDCNFIKIDIEGGEYDLLPTMVAYLKEHRPTLHLSMHPCYLGGTGRASFAGKVRRGLLRLFHTARLLRCVGFYKHFYSDRGEPITSADLLRVCFYGIPCSFVATDRPWDAPGPSANGTGR